MVPALSDLVTILYRPRETMRRILAARDRWTIQLVILALVCASVNDSDTNSLAQWMPDLTVISVVGLVLVTLFCVALFWILALYVAALIVKYIGRLFGGIGVAADIRAAIAWAMVPIVWSVIYRIPFAIYRTRIPSGPGVSEKEAIFSALESGGCSIAIILFAIQAVFFIWCIVLAANTVAEAHKLPVEKGAAILAISLVAPMAIVIAAVFALHINR
jgi:hypothetical protein